MEEGSNLGGGCVHPDLKPGLGSIPMGSSNYSYYIFIIGVYFTMKFVTSEIWITKETVENMFSAITNQRLLDFASNVMSDTLKVCVKTKTLSPGVFSCYQLAAHCLNVSKMQFCTSVGFSLLVPGIKFLHFVFWATLLSPSLLI